MNIFDIVGLLVCCALCGIGIIRLYRLSQASKREIGNKPIFSTTLWTLYDCYGRPVEVELPVGADVEAYCREHGLY